MLLRLCGKYLHLMQMLEPISNNVFSAMTMLLDFYLINVYDIFTSTLQHGHQSAVINPKFRAVIERIHETFNIVAPTEKDLNQR